MAQLGLRILFQIEGSLRVAGARETLGTTALVGVAGGQIPRNLRAFLDVSADRDGGRRRAGTVGLLEAIIATVEARNHPGAPIARGGFGVDQRLHFITPFRTFIAAADAPQVVQGAED